MYSCDHDPVHNIDTSPQWVKFAIIAVLLGTIGFAWFKSQPSFHFGGALTAQDIATLEDTYFNDHGRYLQIMPGSKLPAYESGTVKAKLGTDVPADYAVDVQNEGATKKYIIRQIPPPYLASTSTTP